jgi:hypothetical protein
VSHSQTSPTPTEFYRARLERNELSSARETQRSRRYSVARLLVAIAGIVLAWPALFTDTVPAWLLWLPVISFVALALLHDRVERGRRRLQRAVEQDREGLARLAGEWIGVGADGERFIDAQHPYASDLDLFGEGSLFQRLCAARTADGEATLAAWLQHPATAERLQLRQRGVQELRDRSELRLDLALLGEKIGASVDTEALSGWAEAPPLLVSRWPRFVALLLGLLNVVTFTAWFAPLLEAATAAAEGAPEMQVFDGAPFFLVSIFLTFLFVGTMSKRTLAVLHHADRPQRDLALLGAMLRRLEEELFDCTDLQRETAPLRDDRLRPSVAIRQLTRLVEIEHSRHNHIFNALGGLVLAGTQIAYSLENWRREHGPHVRQWVTALAHFEALSSLARYAFESPQDPFAEILVDGSVRFEAQGLGHPLLPIERCVRNDVRLAADAERLWLLSGSNMAGKSTLLRTVGTNVVLALAGAPVRAERLRLHPLQLGASMRIVDSLHDGASHLYAEIKRLHTIVQLCSGEMPLLFLLDEVLHGTNSGDRRAGADAIIRQLIAGGALGLVTTHDLALAKIADELGPAGANVHLVDHMRDGKLAFDYKLRRGPVTKGNALELMRAIGLDV